MSIDLSRIRALCFDVDGTLSDTDDIYVERVARYLPRFLFQNPRHTARRFVMWVETPGNFLIGVPDILGLDDEALRFWEWLNRHRPRPMKHFIMVPGIKEMLERLHGRYPMAVVSARDDRSTRDFLDKFDLTGYFEEIVTAVTVEHTKPFADPILYAAAKMDVEPEACLMIGDTLVDIRAGKAAGAQTVGVLCGFGERSELERRMTDLILDSTAELADVLLNT